MKCPLKFACYEFEGGTDCIGDEDGTDCIGAECGFYGCVCTDGSPLAESLYTARQRLSETQERLWEIAAERDELKKRVNEQQETLDNDCRDLIENDNEICKLTAERDEWKAKAEQAQESYFDVKADRDAWHARYVTLQDGAHSKAHSKTEPLLTEQSESLSDEADSREKLEADVRQRLIRPSTQIDCTYGDVTRWLDRQAAITERETKLRELYRFEKNHREHIDSIEEVNRELNGRIAELQAKVDELTEQLEAAHAKNRSLKAHIAKMQEGRHGWHVKGVELQRQVDELTAQLRASNAERARLRECLGIATDNAHDFLTLVDESGNVHDRDEGLA